MNKKLDNIFKGDKVVWMVFFFLCIISIIEVYSASSQLTYGGDYIKPMIKHVGILVVGVFCVVVTLNIQCRYFKVMTVFMLGFSIVTLIMVYLIGQSTNGAQRWLEICGIQFQPSEVAKGSLVLATAQILSATQTENGADKNAFRYILTVCAMIIPLIMFENLSTALLLCVVVFMMMLIGRVPARQLGKLLGVSVLLVSAVFAMVMAFGTDKEAQPAAKEYTAQAADSAKKDEGMAWSLLHRFDTWKTRIDKWADNKPVSPQDVDLDKDAQRSHANIAIASSMITGKGPGNSEECDFLSQAFSDFIYAIIIEEMGVPGAVFVALLYIILLFRTGRIASRCENTFPALLAMGLALLLVTQALFNMCVAVGLAPITGQPLPLVSKGGTSTVINCFYIGVILSVSRSAKKRANAVDTPAKEAAVAA